MKSIYIFRADPVNFQADILVKNWDFEQTEYELALRTALESFFSILDFMVENFNGMLYNPEEEIDDSEECSNPRLLILKFSILFKDQYDYIKFRDWANDIS